MIAVPPLSLEHLERGHAVHFRCQHPEATGLRANVMSRMRGVEGFEQLWSRRTTLQADDGTIYQLMALSDPVKAKKTQRDKDWPMIRRLIEADHAACSGTPRAEQVRLWLREVRTPDLLIVLAGQFPAEAELVAANSRPLLSAAMEGITSLGRGICPGNRAHLWRLCSWSREHGLCRRSYGACPPRLCRKAS